MDRVELARRILKLLASERMTITYGRLGGLFDLPAIAVGSQLLEPISRQEHQQGGPMLTALVVGVHTGLPGDQFFELARDYGRFSGEDKQAFWQAELQTVYGYFA